MPDCPWTQISIPVLVPGRIHIVLLGPTHNRILLCGASSTSTDRADQPTQIPVGFTFVGAGLRMVWISDGSGGGAIESREGMEIGNVGGSSTICWKSARVPAIKP